MIKDCSNCHHFDEQLGCTWDGTKDAEFALFMKKAREGVRHKLNPFGLSEDDCIGWCPIESLLVLAEG